jgi:hypothetical protein
MLLHGLAASSLADIAHAAATTAMAHLGKGDVELLRFRVLVQLAESALVRAARQRQLPLLLLPPRPLEEGARVRVARHVPAWCAQARCNAAARQRQSSYIAGWSRTCAACINAVSVRERLTTGAARRQQRLHTSNHAAIEMSSDSSSDSMQPACGPGVSLTACRPRARAPAPCSSSRT